MKKIMTIIISLLISSQVVAGPHGHNNFRSGFSSRPNIGVGNYYNYHNNSNHYNYNYNNSYYGNPRGEWRHTNHNGQLAWWFVVGSMFYLTEQAYINNSGYNIQQPIINIQQPIITNQPIYSTTYTEQRYQNGNGYGWYCETTGLFNTGSNDTCPTPWISRSYK